MAEKVFFVPSIARWKNISNNAKKTEIILEKRKKTDIGGYLDEAMEAIEKLNPSLKGVLPKSYALPNLDRQSLGGLIDLIGSIELGTKQAQERDILGQVYEYFLGQFALKAASFIPPEALSKFSSKCLSLMKAGYSTPAAGRAACSSRVKSL